MIPKAEAHGLSYTELLGKLNGSVALFNSGACNSIDFCSEHLARHFRCRRERKQSLLNEEARAHCRGQTHMQSNVLLPEAFELHFARSCSRRHHENERSRRDRMVLHEEEGGGSPCVVMLMPDVSRHGCPHGWRIHSVHALVGGFNAATRRASLRR
jgi:hypothetical protein